MRGMISPIVITILLYFCTSILTLLNFIKYYNFKAQAKGMCSISRSLFIHFVTTLNLQYLTKLRRVSIEVQKYRSRVRNMGMISPKMYELMFMETYTF